MTLKIRFRSPKSNQFFPSSQQYIYTTLVKIHPMVHKITQGNPILIILKCGSDLEKWVVTKIESSLPLLPTTQLWSKSIRWFRRLCTETIFWTFQCALVTLKIRSRSPKFDVTFPSSQLCMYASIVIIQSLVHKITHRNYISDISGPL